MAFNSEMVYDFIVCGSGSSGSVVAGRLAEDANVRVLLIEAGGSDDSAAVMDPSLWASNHNSERVWDFKAQANPALNGRVLDLPMGKVLGGGSSVNALAWSRGHSRDWDFFADEMDDPDWNYQAVLNLYRRIEDWHGNPDPYYRGSGGPVYVQPAPNPNSIAVAMLDAAVSVGIPKFENQNGRMMEGDGGCSLIDLILRGGKRQSIFRSYISPLRHSSNLTVLTEALVTQVVIDGNHAKGVEVVHRGNLLRLHAACEVILSLGAIQTPKVLMHSGIGDAAELKRFGIPIIQHLPGVGQNLQDHPGFSCVWQTKTPLVPCNNAAEAVFHWKSQANMDAPDLFASCEEVGLGTAETRAQFNPPADAWSFFCGVFRPKSRGRIRLTGAAANDPLLIEANHLEHPDDMVSAMAGIRLCREIGNAAGLQSFVKREVMPGPLSDRDLQGYLRNAVGSWHHESCTAKMGRDETAVVDNRLRVYGVRGLRVADASIMPRIVTGTTMAACVVIGERAADMAKADYGCQ